jgi:hypothetical protein
MTVEERVHEMNARAVAELVSAHKSRRDEPLVLAVQFRLADEDAHLLEVLRGFPGGDEDELLSTEFERSPDLLIFGKLHLVLGSPAQVMAGLSRGDQDIKQAEGGRLLFSDGSPEAAELARMLGL